VRFVHGLVSSGKSLPNSTGLRVRQGEQKNPASPP
jgi:hypothetical protein